MRKEQKGKIVLKHLSQREIHNILGKDDTFTHAAQSVAMIRSRSEHVDGRLQQVPIRRVEEDSPPAQYGN